jgi:hypothetical protein
LPISNFHNNLHLGEYKPVNIGGRGVEKRLMRREFITLKSIKREHGHAWVTLIPKGIIPDSEKRGSQSSLALFENGIELGPAHSMHSLIRSEGGGQFSHWELNEKFSILYFSTSDNSDAATNGREYSVLVSLADEQDSPKVLVPEYPGSEEPQIEALEQPVFIVGMPRSGTTLLFDIFKSHESLVPTTGYPDGEDHIGWIEHGGALLSGFGHSGTQESAVGYTYNLYMDENSLVPENKSRMRNYYDALLKASEGNRVVNKCTQILNKLRYVKAIFPKARFIHIVRDCLPVVASWKTMLERDHKDLVVYWPEEEYSMGWVMRAPLNIDRQSVFGPYDRFFPGGGLERLVDNWMQINSYIPTQMEDSEGSLTTVRYEDLVNDPLNTINNLMDFCGLSRLEELPMEIIKSRNDRYLDILTKSEITRFTELASPIRKVYRYV